MTNDRLFSVRVLDQALQEMIVENMSCLDSEFLSRIEPHLNVLGYPFVQAGTQNPPEGGCVLTGADEGRAAYPLG
jgi:hypothetical protein